MSTWGVVGVLAAMAWAAWWGYRLGRDAQRARMQDMVRRAVDEASEAEMEGLRRSNAVLQYLLDRAAVAQLLGEQQVTLEADDLERIAKMCK